MYLPKDEALRLTQVYSPAALRERLHAFVPSQTEAERRARVERCRSEVRRITAMQAANQDVEVHFE